MNKELKLLPCPFCGGKAQLDFFEKYNGYDDMMPPYTCVMVNCTFPAGCCAGSIEIDYTENTLEDAKQRVIAAWNKRVC